MTEKYINLPISQDELVSLEAGNMVYLSGIIYTARDAAHKRIVNAIKNKEKLPFEINNSAIFYTGPSPTPKGEIIGSCGPTSSIRMDDYTPTLLDLGLKIMIGKGNRGNAVIESIRKNKAVYLCAVGGAAAIVRKYITSAEIIAYSDLGTEAVRRLIVNNFPLIVAIDSNGKTVFSKQE